MWSCQDKYISSELCSLNPPCRRSLKELRASRWLSGLRQGSDRWRDSPSDSRPSKPSSKGLKQGSESCNDSPSDSKMSPRSAGLSSFGGVKHGLMSYLLMQFMLLLLMIFVWSIVWLKLPPKSWLINFVSWLLRLWWICVWFRLIIGGASGWCFTLLFCALECDFDGCFFVFALLAFTAFFDVILPGFTGFTIESRMTSLQ